jgi:hypothetical protein
MPTPAASPKAPNNKVCSMVCQSPGGSIRTMLDVIPHERKVMTRPPRNTRRAYDHEGREIRPMSLGNMREHGVRAASDHSLPAITPANQGGFLVVLAATRGLERLVCTVGGYMTVQLL